MPVKTFQTTGKSRRRDGQGNPLWQMVEFPTTRDVTAGSTLNVAVTLANGAQRELAFDVLQDITAVGVLDDQLVIQVGGGPNPPRRKANPTEVARTK